MTTMNIVNRLGTCIDRLADAPLAPDQKTFEREVDEVRQTLKELRREIVERDQHGTNRAVS